MRFWLSRHELLLDNFNEMGFLPSKDSDQPGHLPSWIIVLAVGSMGS